MVAEGASPPNVFAVNGWRFESESRPILNSKEIDALTEQLLAEGLQCTVPPMPEAIFGNSRLTIIHDATGRTFSFDAAGAIFCWVRESAHKGSGGLRVTTANLPAWKQVACDKALGSATDYDWTFTTDYCGSTGSAYGMSDVPDADPGKTAPVSQWSAHQGSGLDMALLSRRDVPILHFVDIPLYEDDLGDNGESMVRVRLRVMPSCFLVLLRHALRVDGVLIRHHDTRIFHKFGTPQVLRARRMAEAPLESVPKPDLSEKPLVASARSAAPWTAAMPPVGSMGHLISEQSAAEKLSKLPPKFESIEELLL